MNKRDVIVDRRKPTSEEIGNYKDFDQLLANYGVVTKPWYKTWGFMGGATGLATIAIVAGVYLSGDKPNQTVVQTEVPNQEAVLSVVDAVKEIPADGGNEALAAANRKEMISELTTQVNEIDHNMTAIFEQIDEIEDKFNANKPEAPIKPEHQTDGMPTFGTGVILDVELEANRDKIITWAHDPSVQQSVDYAQANAKKWDDLIQNTLPNGKTELVFKNSKEEVRIEVYMVPEEHLEALNDYNREYRKFARELEEHVLMEQAQKKPLEAKLKELRKTKKQLETQVIELNKQSYFVNQEVPGAGGNLAELQNNKQNKTHVRP